MNAHFEERDGCDHGRTGKICRPDPQPLHGKDCLTHGNHGGINEDHCLASPTTTTTAPPTTTSTTITTTTTTTVPGVPATTTTSVPELTATTTTTTTTPSAPVAPALTAVELVSPSRPAELAHTGAETPILAGLGLALVVVGAALKRRFRD